MVFNGVTSTSGLVVTGTGCIGFVELIASRTGWYSKGFLSVRCRIGDLGVEGILIAAVGVGDKVADGGVDGALTISGNSPRDTMRSLVCRRCLRLRR